MEITDNGGGPQGPPAALNIAELRREYQRASLSETEVDPDPLRQFQSWLQEAISAELPEPTAMTLATVGANGAPAARIVLLKGFDASGFVFFTNYQSHKGSELEAILRNVHSEFQAIVTASPTLSDELQTIALNIEEPGRLVDFIASSLPFLATTDKQ